MPRIEELDAVLLTHEHADHTHGIDDLRPLFVKTRRPVDIYMDEPTSRAMHARFGYCFMTPPGSQYPPTLREHRLTPGKAVTINGKGGPIEVLPILQDHGDIPSLGFRFGNLAYSCDIKGLPDESLPLMAGLDLWIVDALRIHAASQPHEPGGEPGLDCAGEDQAGHPDQPALRSGLRGSTPPVAAAHRAGIRRDGSRDCVKLNCLKSSLSV